MKTLANSRFKLFQLKQHLNNAHEEQASVSIEYCASKEGCLKRVRLDARRAFHFAFALSIAKAKKIT